MWAHSERGMSKHRLKQKEREKERETFVTLQLAITV